MKYNTLRVTTIFVFMICLISTDSLAQNWNNANGGTALWTNKRVTMSSNNEAPGDTKMNIVTDDDRFGLFIQNNTPSAATLPLPGVDLCLEYAGANWEEELFGIYVKMPALIGYAGYFEGSLGACGPFDLHYSNGAGGIHSSWRFNPQGGGLSLRGSGQSNLFFNNGPTATEAYQKITVEDVGMAALSIGVWNNSQNKLRVMGTGEVETWGGLTVYNNYAGGKPIMLKQEGSQGLERFYVAADGHVWSNKALSVEVSSNTNKAIEVTDAGSRMFSVSKEGYVYSNEGFKVSPTTQGNDAFVIQPEGSGNKIFKITKEGNIFAREIRVTQLGIPDYVFKDDYDLMPIKEVEIFVKKYKHLPNIPSEKEILASGLNLGDQQMRQLEKIEELTLYIIEMNKRLDRLENENNQLKSKVDSLSSTNKVED